MVEELGFPTFRVSAVDGNSLDDSTLKSVVNIKAFRYFRGYYPKKGSIGCSLSHIEAWKKFLDSDFEYALIFEDDADFNPAELSKVVDELMQNKELWDINAFQLFHRGMPLSIKQLTGIKRQLVYYLGSTVRSASYILRRSAAEKLLAKALPIIMELDFYFARPWEFDLIFTGVEPRCVFQRLLKSQIKTTANVMSSSRINKNLFSRIFERYFHLAFLNSRLLRWQTEIYRIFYNLKLYFRLKK